MGAWLQRGGESTPIHMPGFDTHPVGDFYEVERLLDGGAVVPPGRSRGRKM